MSDNKDNAPERIFVAKANNKTSSSGKWYWADVREGLTEGREYNC